MSLPMEIRQNSRQVDKKKAPHILLPSATPQVWKHTRDSIECEVLFKHPFDLEGHEKKWKKIIKKVNTSLHLKTILQEQRFLFQVRQAMRGHHRNLRIDLHKTCNNVVRKMYKLDIKSPEENVKLVADLLNGDRFICHPDGYQDHARRFEAPILVNVLISHFYGIKKPDPIDRKLDRPEQLKLGWRVPQFVQQINGPFLSLLSAGIFHSLLNWSKGTFQPEKFKGRSEAKIYEARLNVWKMLSRENREKVIKGVKSEVQSHANTLMATMEYLQGGDNYLDSLLSGAPPLSRNPVHVAPSTPSISPAVRHRAALRENPPISGKLKATGENFQGSQIHLDTPPSDPQKTPPYSHNPINMTLNTLIISPLVRHSEVTAEEISRQDTLRAKLKLPRRRTNHVATPPSEPPKDSQSSISPDDPTHITPESAPSMRHPEVTHEEDSELAAQRTPLYYGTKLYKVPSPSSEGTDKSLEPSSTPPSTPLHHGAKYYKVPSPSFESKDKSLELSSTLPRHEQKAKEKKHDAKRPYMLGRNGKEEMKKWKEDGKKIRELRRGWKRVSIESEE